MATTPRPTKKTNRTNGGWWRRPQALHKASPWLIVALFAVGGTITLLITHAESWTLQTPGKTYSFKQTAITGGLTNRRFELRSGDQWPSDAASYTDGRQRVEMRGGTYWARNTDVWMAFSLRWSGQLPSTWTTLTQFHSQPESCETAGKPPAFSLNTSDGMLYLNTRSDSRSCTTSQVDGVNRFAMTMFPANTWQRIVMRVRFDPSGNGNLALWINGNQKYNKSSIPIGYNDATGPYFKHGMYRGKSTATTVFEFANVEVTTSSLSGRITKPLPLP